RVDEDWGSFRNKELRSCPLLLLKLIWHEFEGHTQRGFTLSNGLSRPRPRVRNCLGVLYDLVKVLPCFIFTHLQHLAQNKQRGCARCRRVGELELSGPLGICKLLPGLWKLVLTPFFGVIRNSEREDIGPDPIPLLLMHLDRPFKHFPILCSL